MLTVAFIVAKTGKFGKNSKAFNRFFLKNHLEFIFLFKAEEKS